MCLYMGKSRGKVKSKKKKGNTPSTYSSSSTLKNY